MRLLGKDLLTTARDNAKEACGGFQLCEGLEVGILRVLLILFARCGRMRVGHLIKSLMLKIHLCLLLKLLSLKKQLMKKN